MSASLSLHSGNLIPNFIIDETHFWCKVDVFKPIANKLTSEALAVAHHQFQVCPNLPVWLLDYPTNMINNNKFNFKPLLKLYKRLPFNIIKPPLKPKGHDPQTFQSSSSLFICCAEIWKTLGHQNMSNLVNLYINVHLKNVSIPCNYFFLPTYFSNLVIQRNFFSSHFHYYLIQQNAIKFGWNFKSFRIKWNNFYAMRLIIAISYWTRVTLE